MDQLTAYITENLSKGVSRQAITSYLLSLGWQQKDIEAAFTQAQASQSQPQNTQQQQQLNAVQSPPKKSFLNLKVIIILIVAILLIAGSSGYYFLFYQKKSGPNLTSQAGDTQKDSTTPAIIASPAATTAVDQPVTASTPKNYPACFSKYDKKFAPESISSYKRTELHEVPNPVSESGFKATWSIAAKYKSEKINLIINVVDLADLTTYYQYKPYLADPTTIDGLEVFQGTLSETSGPSKKGATLLSFVPDTLVEISFQFEPPATDANEIFATWLKTVCS